MKQVMYLFFQLTLTIALKAQLMVNENFTNYAFGNLGNQGSWVQNGNGAEVQVLGSPSLGYVGYQSGGNFISVAAVNGFDPHKLFASSVPTSAASTFYLSFAVKASNAVSSTTSEYSVVMRNTGNIAYLSRFFLIKNAINNLEFGISKGSATASNVTSGDYQFNRTYLIVMRYDVVPGSSNDRMHLWVNPDLSVEPDPAEANLSLITGTDASYGSAIDALMIHQRSSNSPIAHYDAFRVANGQTHQDAWMYLSAQGNSLPVTLHSFKGVSTNDRVKLTWKVSEEVNVSRYEIERSSEGISFTKVGALPADRKLTYFFEDDSPDEINFYRLKMVDMDGSEKRSGVIRVIIPRKAECEIYPNPVSRTLFIESSGDFVGGELSLINDEGRQVKQVKITSVLISIDCTGLKKGIYYAFCRNGQNVKWKMIIKE